MLLFNSYNWRRNLPKRTASNFHHSKKIYWRLWFFSFLFFSIIFLKYSNVSFMFRKRLNQTNISAPINYKNNAIPISYFDVFISQRRPENSSLYEWLYDHSFIYFHITRTLLNPYFLLVTDFNNQLSIILSQLRLIPFSKSVLTFPAMQKKGALPESPKKSVPKKAILYKGFDPIKNILFQRTPRTLLLIGETNWYMLSNSIIIKKKQFLNGTYSFFSRKVHRLNFFLFTAEKLLSKILNKYTAKETSFIKFVQEVNRFASSKIVDLQLTNSSSTRALKKHSLEFRKRIEQITDNIFIGIGYGLANTIVIVGKQGTVKRLNK
jgi:hypothetical protein